MDRGNPQGGLKLPVGIEVNPGAKGSIRIVFHYRGRRYRETINIKPTKTNIKFAVNMRASILHEIATGVFEFAKHFPNSPRLTSVGGHQNNTLTVGAALDEYIISMRRTTAVSTWKDYESAIRAHLKPHFGHIRIKELTTRHVRAWLGGLLISNKRINNVLVPLRGVLKDAFSDGVIDRDPMARIKNLPVRTEEPEPFNEIERGSILNAIEKMAMPQAKNLVQFAFWSGMRTSELLALEWGDVDFISRVVRVRRANVRGDIKTPKTKSGERDVFILPSAMDALINQKSFSFLIGGCIFRRDWDNEPWISDNQITRRVWIHALKRAGVLHRGIYQSRHTYASIMLSGGENPAWIAKQMGHVNMGMLLSRYARWIPDEDNVMRKRLIEKYSENDPVEKLGKG